MSVFGLLALCIGCGMLLAAQPVINARLAAHLQSPFAATFVSLFVSIACVLPAALAFGTAPRLEALGAAPWWVWIGGLSGAVFVAVGLLLAPRVGIALFFCSLVAGQLLSAALIDHYGLFGMPVRPIDWPRVLGLVLVLAGVAVFRLAGGAGK